MVCDATVILENEDFGGWDVAAFEDNPFLIEENDNSQINLLDYIGSNCSKGYRKELVSWFDEVE